MIVIISGTNRPGSNTRKVSARVEAAYKSLGAQVQVLDLGELPQEIFSPASYTAKPPRFQKFIDAILTSDGLVVVTPEYNGGFPGVLKYFVDMLPFPESFQKRPTCFVGLAAGMWGALRPVEQLQVIFAYRNALIFPERVFIPAIGAALNAEGNFTDPDIEKRLAAQASAFLSFAETVQGKKLR